MPNNFMHLAIKAAPLALLVCLGGCLTIDTIKNRDYHDKSLRHVSTSRQVNNDAVLEFEATPLFYIKETRESFWVRISTESLFARPSHTVSEWPLSEGRIPSGLHTEEQMNTCLTTALLEQAPYKYIFILQDKCSGEKTQLNLGVYRYNTVRRNKFLIPFLMPFTMVADIFATPLYFALRSAYGSMH